MAQTSIDGLPPFKELDVAVEEGDVEEGGKGGYGGNAETAGGGGNKNISRGNRAHFQPPNIYNPLQNS